MTSPTRRDQPTPMPSDWNIINNRKTNNFENLNKTIEWSDSENTALPNDTTELLDTEIFDLFDDENINFFTTTDQTDTLEVSPDYIVDDPFIDFDFNNDDDDDGFVYKERLIQKRSGKRSVYNNDDILTLNDDQVTFSNLHRVKKPKTKEDLANEIKIKNLANLEILASVAARANSKIQRTKSLTKIPTKNYTKLPTTPSFIIVYSFNGTAMYLPRHSQRLLNSVEATHPRQNLVTCNVSLLLKQFEKEIIERKNEEVEDLNQNHGIKINIEECLNMKKTQNLNKLWVDKYSPRAYIDLAGDERTNREVLTWVKEWDFCVFGKQKKPLEPRLLAKKQKFNYQQKDTLLRPEKKVLLLSGPPGLGKTTLAHIVARHAGYNVVEVNASDERTGEALKNRLIGAVQTQSVMGNKRPNLLIIDEIDGANSGGSGDQNFMNVLIDLVTAEKSRTVTKKKQSQDLLRPIICICNDVYAPVLKLLRVHAKIVTFRSHSYKSLAKRLQEICRWEGLKADVRAVTSLCELADGDIRNCLNTLQFVKKQTSVLSVKMVESLNIGHKDVLSSLFSIWGMIFTLVSAMTRKEKAILLNDSESDSSDSNSGTHRFVSKLSALISVNGDYGKIMQGCFENYLRIRIFDTGGVGSLRSSSSSSQEITSVSSVSKIEQALDWICFYDSIDKRVNGSDHQYEVLQYMSYPIVAFHQLFASGRRPDQIQFPKSDYENYIISKENSQILNTFGSSLDVVARRNWTNPSLLTTELIPCLFQIISPEIRSVNIQLIKPHEKIVLKRLVEVMTVFGLSFLQSKTDTGNYKYTLEPPLEKIIAPFANGAKLLSSTYPVRQMISQEIEREKIRRIDVKHSDSEKTPKKNLLAPISTRTTKSVKNEINFKATT
ncbi:hypothetical protein HK096_003776, partial [Nowakowskiella sp. JEL0078]